MLNLLGNAAEFTEHGGLVPLEIKENRQGLARSLSDSGPGISTGDQTVIFDRFRHLEAGANKGHRGHSMGLCICSALADRQQTFVFVPH